MSLFPTVHLAVFVLETDLTTFVEQIVAHYETKCLAHETEINDLEDDAYSRGRSELLDEIKNYLENI